MFVYENRILLYLYIFMSIFCLCRLNLEACFNLRLGINNIKLVLHGTHVPISTVPCPPLFTNNMWVLIILTEFIIYAGVMRMGYNLSFISEKIRKFNHFLYVCMSISWMCPCVHAWWTCKFSSSL